MRISGEMLRAGWLSDGEELYTNVQHTEYFTSVQILDKNTQILEDQTLYIQNKSEMPDILSDKTRDRPENSTVLERECRYICWDSESDIQNYT